VQLTPCLTGCAGWLGRRVNRTLACSYLAQLDVGEHGCRTPSLYLYTPIGVGIAVELLGSDIRGT
jgi:hypothetical protein